VSHSKTKTQPETVSVDSLVFVKLNVVWSVIYSMSFTVNREIFVVEKFSLSHKATKINLTKYLLQRIFSTANNYDAYYTPRHSTCLCLTITLATVYFLVAKTANTHATAFEVNVL